VAKASEMGYITVIWDDGIEDRYSPMLAATTLIAITDDDALPRHDWDMSIDIDPPCVKCRVTQTDENELGPCRGEHNER
jgi:hypothetical protein